MAYNHCLECVPDETTGRFRTAVEKCEEKMSRINLMLFMICLAGLVLSGGCENEARTTGKFTEEEMADIPFANQDNLLPLSGGLALSVRSETITIQEIVTPVMKRLNPPAGIDRDTFKFRARPVVKDAVVEKITDILLYQEAKKDAPENIDELLETAVEVEVNKLRYNQAHADIAEQGMDWEQYREFQKKMLLIRSYYASQNLLEDKPVSHSEMLEHYKAMQQDGFQFRGLLKPEDVKWDGFIEFSLIDIKIDDREMPRSTAIQKAEGLIERINNGEDFGELAKVHSDGHRKDKGGLWTPVSEGSLVKAYQPIWDRAEKMEVGEVAGPIESDGHIFVMKLEQKKKGGVAAFEDLQARIEQDIHLARRKKHFDRLVSKLIRDARISGLEQFVDVCLEKAWRRWESDGSLSSK